MSSNIFWASKKGLPYIFPYSVNKKFGYKFNKIVNIRVPCPVYLLPDESAPKAVRKRGHGRRYSYVRSTYAVEVGVFWLAEMDDETAQDIVAEYNRSMLAVAS